MGRPPCCDKGGVKKGPWTPEEDIILVSFIQEHGPGNWRAVPTKTGLLRCSKSCRLRWTNYLRPGIRRGSFTEQEEKMIIHLQALLGNRWTAIASYLPQRTDNDIKNYWNTHLKKKLRRLQAGPEDHLRDGLSSIASQPISRDQWERRLQTDIDMARKALCDALSPEKTSSSADFKPSTTTSGYLNNDYSKPTPSTSTYASSTENIAKLLRGWMRNGTKVQGQTSSTTTQNSFNNVVGADSTSTGWSPSNIKEEKNGVQMSEAFESLFGFESFDSSNSDFSQSNMSPEATFFLDESKPTSNIISHNQEPLLLLEKWLFDEGDTEGKELYPSVISIGEDNIF